MLLKCRLMRTALRGVLTIYERVILLSILVGMRESYLNIFAFDVDYRVECVCGHIILQEILKSVSGEDAPSVVHDGESGVEICIIAEHSLHDIIMEGVVFEERSIRLKVDVSAGFILCRLSGVADDDAFLKLCRAHLSVTIRAYFEVSAEKVDSLDAHTVHSHRLFESL